MRRGGWFGRVRLGVLVALALVVPGCQGLNNLKARAAYDMQCPEEQLELTKLSRTVYGVRGCGRQGTYICRTRDAKNCEDWVLNATMQ